MLKFAVCNVAFAFTLKLDSKIGIINLTGQHLHCGGQICIVFLVKDEWIIASLSNHGLDFRKIRYPFLASADNEVYEARV